MKFKVHADGTTGRALAALLQKIKDTGNANRDWLASKGFDPTVAKDTLCLAGGLRGIHFPEAPKDWKGTKLGDGRTYYYPIKGRKSTRDILAEIEALPSVEVFEANGVIGWDGFINRYGLARRGDYFLLNVPANEDTGAPTAEGLEEITNLEYEQRLAEVPA